MRLDDLDAVMAIEAVSFPTPWPRSGYEHELTANANAHYAVLLGPADEIIGYAGQWLVAGEGHISIMAVAPAWRRRGLGELLLSSMIAQAEEAGAGRILLEVRTGNRTALALYRKYHFEVVGRRHRYYRDTGEDALLMTLELDRPRVREHLQRHRQELQARLASTDNVEDTDR
ncbi:MAG: ribosomal protein S18-alanine N-acetyltransferase [Anaerolineae bacterium]|nr:ribosomal protein S18-alanine N-acetyltransferase [Anaerolineae bacterium]